MSEPSSPRTKPGSRAHQIVEVAATLTTALQRGATVGELRNAFEKASETEAPASFTSEVHSLKRRGVLEVVGGRPGRTLYAPAGSGLEGRQNDEDEVLQVLTSLRAGYSRLGRPLSTREVAEGVATHFPDLDLHNANTVRKHLETLSRRTTRGPKEWREPKVVRVESATGSSVESAHWAPAEVELAETAAAPRSKADAVRAAVGVASRDLGRPITSPELRWWLKRSSSHVIHGGALTHDSVGTILSDAARADRSVSGEEGRLREVRTWRSCHGGPPSRYALAEPDDAALLVCELEDLLDLLRPADEMDSIRRLRTLSNRLRSPTLGGLADLREQLLHYRIAAWGGVVDRPAVFVKALHAQKVLARWYSESAGLTDNEADLRRRGFYRWQEQFTVAQAMWLEDPPQELGQLETVGHAATVSLDELQPLLTAAADLLGVEGKRRRMNLVADVPRVPLPLEQEPGQERIGAADQLPLSLLDRPRALLTLWELFPVPRASVLLRTAFDVLGYVLRDAKLLRLMLDRLPEGEAVARRSLVVALGLLGAPAPWEVAVPGEAPADVAAWTLAVVLAEGEGAEPTLKGAAKEVDGTPRRLVEQAHLRVQRGYFVSVVE